MQALTRNPLAEPGVLGVNAGSSFAVVPAIAVGRVGAVSGHVRFSFVGSAAAAVLVRTMTRCRPGVGVARLVLAGVALAAVLGPVTGTITMCDTDVFDSYRFRTLGSFAERDMLTLAWVGPFIAAGLVVAPACGRGLNALALGDEQAAALGARLGVVRVASLVAIALLCGAATAAAGPVGFVGLVVPYVLRVLVGGGSGADRFIVLDRRLPRAIAARLAGAGVRPARRRLVMLVHGVLLVAVVVAVTGPIGFLALAAPQPARRLAGTPGTAFGRASRWAARSWARRVFAPSARSRPSRSPSA